MARYSAVNYVNVYLGPDRMLATFGRSTNKERMYTVRSTETCDRLNRIFSHNLALIYDVRCRLGALDVRVDVRDLQCAV